MLQMGAESDRDLECFHKHKQNCGHTNFSLLQPSKAFKESSGAGVGEGNYQHSLCRIPPIIRICTFQLVTFSFESLSLSPYIMLILTPIVSAVILPHGALKHFIHIPLIHRIVCTEHLQWWKTGTKKNKQKQNSSLEWVLHFR